MSTKKNKGLKRGSVAHMNYLDAKQLKQCIDEENDNRDFRFVCKTEMVDCVCVALGRVGFDEQFFKDFDKVLTEVADEFHREFLQEYNESTGKDAWGKSEYAQRMKNTIDPIAVSKDRFDRELKSYIGEELFIPWNKRYDRFYMEGRP